MDYELFDANSEESIDNFTQSLSRMNEHTLYLKFLKFNLEKIIKVLTKVNEYDYASEKNKRLLRLVQILVPLKPVEFSKELVFIDLLLKIYRRFITFAINYDKSNTINLHNIELLLRIYKTLYHINKSNKVIDICIVANLPKLTFQILNKVDFLDDESIKNEIIFSLFYYTTYFLFSILPSIEIFKIVKQNGFQTFFLAQFYALETILHKRDELKYLKLNYIAVLASILDEKEFKKLKMTYEVIEFTLYILDEAIKNSEAISQQDVSVRLTADRTIYDRSPSFVLQVILIMASNESIKEKIIKLSSDNIFKYLNELIETGSSKDKELSSHITCLLCFNTKVTDYFKTNRNLIENINKTLLNTTNEETRRYCKQALQLIYSNRNSEMASSIPKYEPFKPQHVMISYCQDDSEICTEINKALGKWGYKTWMGERQANYDSFETMTYAIQNSSVILVCYSEYYKLSTNCKFEAHYADELNKVLIFVPVQKNCILNGWLASLLESKLTIKPEEFLGVVDNAYMTKIAIKIDYAIKNSMDSKLITQILQRPQEKKETEEKSAAKIYTDKAIESWSWAETKVWFIRNEMEIFSRVFPKCTGKTLKCLWELKQNDNEEFVQSIYREFQRLDINAGINEIISFSETLAKLFD